MKPEHIIAIILAVLLLVWFLQPKKSNMAQFRGKKPVEKCLEGWTELTPEICTRDA
jgi:hypothetical protein